MTNTSVQQETAKTVARGMVRGSSSRLKENIEPQADEVMREAADRVEEVADQVRELGKKLDRRDQAHSVARRLEKAADYLNYRPPSEATTDAWKAITRSKVLWVGAGLLGGWVAYRIVRSSPEGS
jgi:hypothetical protein